jgi:hypothetical protein
LKQRRAWGAVIALAAAALVTGALAAQSTSPAGARAEEGRPIVIGKSHELPSKLLKDVRRINVYLPPHHGESGRKFPVLFLLDGGEKEDFLHIAGLAQITSAYGEGEEMIVVGIEGRDRRRDLTSPSSVASDLKRAPTSGGATAYRRFLVEELKPWVASRFSTDGRTALIGESLAGLFVLETLFEEPGAFSDYIAVSPSLWWNQSRLATEAEARLRKTRFSGQRLWIGFETPPPPADQAAKERAVQDRLEAAFKAAAPAGLSWSATRLPEGHSSIYHPAALQALQMLYKAKVPE